MNDRLRPFAGFTKEDARRIKWVLCDIDDTITTEGKLPKSSYSALWDLHEAGIGVIPVTGRPAGWCDMIVRQWPVDAVVGENGAFVMYFDGPELKRHLHPNVAPDAQQRLAAVRDAVLKAVPGCRVAKDQFSRIYDLAVDFAEDEPRLPLSAAEEIKAVCESFGAVAKISSIHVNAWFGSYDKVSMARMFFNDVLGVEDMTHCAIFFGDSPNDEPMFRFLPMSCAVGNIRPFAGRMEHLPQWVTEGCGGEGFSEAVEHILQLRG